MFDQVFHVGTLESLQKGLTHNRCSLEGNGLSVSVEPAAWQKIARLGGQPIWELQAPSQTQQHGAGLGAGLFLDIYELKSEHWAEVMDWALKNDLVERALLLEVSWLNEDNLREYTLFDGTDPKGVRNAQEEVDARQEEDDTSEPRLEKRDDFKATAALNSRIGFEVDIFLVKDMAMTLYVEDVLHAAHGIQGCWWDDELDVYSYSAPRGVIHLKALQGWAREEVRSRDEYSEDEQEHASQPAPQG